MKNMDGEEVKGYFLQFMKRLKTERYFHGHGSIYWRFTAK